jgi:excisionase family DNA binding protein
LPGEEAMKEDATEIFTLDEVAAYLKLGKRTVYRLAAAKKIPAFKVGGTWRFQRQEIDQWIKRQTAEPRVMMVLANLMAGMAERVAPCSHDWTAW